MAVITYNDRLRQLLANVECVLAFDTAADFLGLTNGGYRTAAQIFVNKKQDIGGTEQILVPSLEALEYEERNGLRCTTVNQTIVDLLEQNGDEQIITESLANYYDEHQESFDGLEIPEHLQSGKTTHRRLSEWPEILTGTGLESFRQWEKWSGISITCGMHNFRLL